MEKVSGLLKGFVIGSGIILVVGTVALAVLLVLRVAGDGQPAPPGTDQPLTSEVALPPGARVEQLMPHGDHVLILGTAGDGLQFIAVLDPATGLRLRLIRLVGDAGSSP